ncbi:MAG: hypothetical protein KAT28_01705 [Candidatus Aenigmarchaeota archaeon]|nr:hypothetical protein [Candidatus Aenigmarchaeota archaeon]
MKMKGVELPVNSVIVIALAIMVLLMIAAFLMGGVGQMSSTDVDNAWNRGCGVLKNTYKCDDTKVSTIDSGIDVTGDGVSDTLSHVCIKKFGQTSEGADITDKFCRNKCCNTIISTTLDCAVNIDCASAVGGIGWTCNATGKCEK